MSGDNKGDKKAKAANDLEVGSTSLLCVAGCLDFGGGEKRHHKDCPFYPESFSKMYDDLKAVSDVKRWCNTCKSNNNLMNCNCKTCLRAESPVMHVQIKHTTVHESHAPLGGKEIG